MVPDQQKKKITSNPVNTLYQNSTTLAILISKDHQSK